MYGKTKAEVKRRLIAAQRDHQLGLLPTGRVQTVEQVLRAWLEQVARPRVRPRTYIRYRQVVEQYLIPGLGRYPVDRLRPDQVQAFLNSKAAELSPRSVHHLRAILRTGLANAVRWGAVPRNVVTLTDPPRVPDQHVTVLDPAQAGTLLRAAAGHDHEALITVAIALGLRQGEALGLRWQDVDLGGRQLHVRNALQRLDGHLQLVEPKTEQSRRTITLPSAVVAALQLQRAHQAAQRGALIHESGYVFAHPDGSPLDGTRVTRQFQRLLATAGLPRMTFHQLRHSCASLLLAQGVSPKGVQEVLGHSNVSTTLNIYSHLLPSVRQDIADAMDRMLGG
jgi:integrase